MRLVVVSLLATLIAGCTLTITPGVPVVNPYAKQFDGQLGGNPKVDDLGPARR